MQSSNMAASKVRMTALDIQVSLRNPTAILEDSMTSVKMLYHSNNWFKFLK